MQEAIVQDCLSKQTAAGIEIFRLSPQRIIYNRTNTRIVLYGKIKALTVGLNEDSNKTFIKDIFSFSTNTNTPLDL